MILDRVSESELMGIKVEKASRASPESETRSVQDQWRSSAVRDTLFADLEQLISFPGNNSSGESAPAPFQHTAEDL